MRIKYCNSLPVGAFQSFSRDCENFLLPKISQLITVLYLITILYSFVRNENVYVLYGLTRTTLVSSAGKRKG